MARMMTVDFYRVDVTGGHDFQRLLADVYALPPEERNRTGSSSPIRLQEYTPNEDILEGDMLKIRMDEVPLKASLHGSTRFIDLNDDEGIGEETAFYYYVPWRVLLLQRNRHAVSASAFTWYFNHISDGGPIIGLIPILRSDIMQRLARMSIMKKLDVKIAGVENAEIFRGEGYGVGAIIDLKDAFAAPNVSVSVSMGRRRGSLLLERVRETITGLLRISGHDDRHLKKLAVEAQEDYTSTTELLDILKSRIIEQIDIDPTADRRLPYERRKEALREVFSRRRTELRQMFG